MSVHPGSPHGSRGPLLFTVAVGVLVLVMLSALSPRGRESVASSSSAAPTATPSDRSSYLGPSAKPPQPVELHSRWVRQTADPVIGVGQTASVTVEFENTGIERWIKGSPSEIRLGVKGDSRAFADAGMAVEWPSPTRPAVQSEGEVVSGANGTFSFTVKGVKPGAYRLALRLVCDGVAWLDDDGVVVTVTVR